MSIIWGADSQIFPTFHLVHMRNRCYRFCVAKYVKAVKSLILNARLLKLTNNGYLGFLGPQGGERPFYPTLPLGLIPIH